MGISGPLDFRLFDAEVDSDYVAVYRRRAQGVRPEALLRPSSQYVSNTIGAADQLLFYNDSNGAWEATGTDLVWAESGSDRRLEATSTVSPFVGKRSNDDDDVRGALILQRNRDAGTGTAGDGIGARLNFQIENDAGQATSTVHLDAILDDVSDGTEDGSLLISVISGGTAPEARTESLGIYSDGIRLAGGTDTLTTYDEGTFTPTLGASTSDGTHVYQQQDGRYTQIGRVVYFHVRIQIDTKNSSGTITGNIQIKGLPFTAAGGAANPAVSISFINNIQATQLTGYVVSGTSRIALWDAGIATTSSTGSFITEADLGNNPDLFVSGFYEV